MGPRNIRRPSNATASIGLLLFALPISVALAAGPTVGNPTTNRKSVDTYSDFTVIDTNHPVNASGALSKFQYYAANRNAFEFVLVDKNNVVQWISPPILPSGEGAGTYAAEKPVPVQAGWNLGVHSESTGVIPFDQPGARIVSTANNSGAPTVGSAIKPFNIPSGTFARVYSISAQ
jgi:hypothetical protein